MTRTEPPGFLAAVARALVRHPWKVVLAALALGLLAGGLAWQRLGIQTDRMALIGAQHRYNQNFHKLQAEFGDLDSIVVVVEAPTRDAARRAARLLAARIEAAPELFPGLFDRVPEEALRGKALLFLDAGALGEIEASLTAGAAPVAALFHSGLGAFFDESARLVRDLVDQGALAGASSPQPPSAKALGFLVPFADGAAGALRGEPYVPPWESWIPAGALQDRDGHLWTQDGRLVLLVQPRREGDAERESVAALRRIVDDLEAPGVRVGLTGEPVLEVDELETFRADAQLATLASLFGVTVLFSLSFRRLLGPVLATLALGIAVLCTLGFATLWPGHLNLISVAFCALLVGLGIDYGIHLISRYDEERGRGLTAEEALLAALHRTGRAIAAGGLTTALAFLATLFTEVEGIREFGVVAGVGVLLCLTSNLVVLPCLVVLADRGRGGRQRRPRSAWPRSRLANALDRLVERRPVAIVVGALLLAGGSLAFALWPVTGPDGSVDTRLGYRPNLLELQAQQLESVRLAGEVLADEGIAGMFAAIVVEDVASLRRTEEAVRKLPSVGGTDSILDVIPPDQPKKLAILARIRGCLEAARPTAPPSDGAASARLRGLADGAEALVSALEDVARAALAQDMTEVVDRIASIQDRLETLTDVGADLQQAERLLRYEETVCGDLRAALARLREECATAPVTIEDLPQEIQDRFIGRTGKHLLRVYPAEDVWRGHELGRFVEDLKRIVPDVGGVPVQFHESDLLLRRGYVRAGQLALVFVIFYLVVHFRSVRLPLIATATVLVGASWGLGALVLVGIHINPANLLALPLTLGIGVDYAIHIVDRDREARRFRSLAGAPAVLATSTGRAVFLSSLTTMVGFGALCLSAHRGVASIGWTICIGVLASLAAALLLCPALLRLSAGPSPPLPLEGEPGPKTGPGGWTNRPE